MLPLHTLQWRFVIGREGAVDNAQRIVGRVVKKGSTVFLVAGSGSDFTALNLEERKQFVEACG